MVHRHGCDLEVGHLQAGVLVVNVDRVQVTDNVMRAGTRPADDALMKDADYCALLRPQLISGIVTVPSVERPTRTQAWKFQQSNRT